MHFRLSQSSVSTEVLQKGSSEFLLFLSMTIQSFTGHNQLRQRLLLATLSSKAVRIDEIRAGEDKPGLAGKTQT